MTAHQAKILEQVEALLTEHFDSYQLSAQISDFEDRESGDVYVHQSSGPMATIMGMLDMHKMNIAKLYISDRD